jgi:hypothetical protein
MLDQFAGAKPSHRTVHTVWAVWPQLVMIADGNGADATASKTRCRICPAGIELVSE